MITAEHFEKATGRAPEDDDLNRANCPEAGLVGHMSCGWDHERDLPVYETGSRYYVEFRRSLAKMDMNSNLPLAASTTFYADDLGRAITETAQEKLKEIQEKLEREKPDA